MVLFGQSSFPIIGNSAVTAAKTKRLYMSVTFQNQIPSSSVCVCVCVCVYVYVCVSDFTVTEA